MRKIFGFLLMMPALIVLGYLMYDIAVKTVDFESLVKLAIVLGTFFILVAFFAGLEMVLFGHESPRDGFDI